MGFLYKHYEKIVLAVFLLVFVSALVYLIMVFSQSKDISEEDLKIRPTGQDYKRIFDEDGNEKVPEGKKGKFSSVESFKDESKWNPSVKRNPNALNSSDFMVPFKAARCHKCKKLIPKTAFDAGKCPLCKQDPGPMKNIVIIDQNKDTDEDGMPDKYEENIPGLDPKDARDKWADLDSDGFPNFLEFKAKTKPDDIKSHPPLAERLALFGMRRKPLTLKLDNVEKRGSEDKKDWLITIKIVGKRGRYVTEFKSLGDTVNLDRRKKNFYKIIDVVYKVEEKFDNTIGRPIDVNVSEITIQNAADSDEEPIKVVVGQNAYENKAIVGFIDTVSEKKYVKREGDKFTVGNEELGPEEYTIISVDLKNRDMAVIENSDKKQFKIRKQSTIDKFKEDATTSEDSGQQNDGTEDDGSGEPDNNTAQPYVPAI